MQFFNFGNLMNRLSTFCLCSVLAIAVHAQPADSVFHEADCRGSAVLLIFSGSDWCAPCIRFERQVVSSDLFQQYAKDHLVVLVADFPQRKKLPPGEKRQNEALAQLYNQEGIFPKILLLRPERSIIVNLGYRNQSPEVFIKEISSYLEDAVKGS